MKKILFLLFALFLVTSCTTRKNISDTTKIVKSSSTRTASLIDKIISTAESYQGTPYKYGGTTKSGMDCSGLIHQVFLQNGISFPRISRNQAEKGKRIVKRNLNKGDLLYFSTSRSGGVSHVGLVHHIDNDEVFFIHSSSSKGVIVSSLNSKYWSKAFLFAMRVL